MAPDLSNAQWLKDERLQKLFAVIAAAGGEARVAGGAVRNALMGLPHSDIDLATTLLPEQLIIACAAAGMKPYPTGIAHGTITVVLDDAYFEVTTLRVDVTTDGRHADVSFTADWAADAARRDFTMNALYCDADGKIYDFTDGYKDILARRVKFVGEPEQRIAEDHLRILRFFRFFAQFGEGAIDAAGLAASISLSAGIALLSAERIRVEMLKLLVAKEAVKTLTVMRDAGILELIIPCKDDIAVVDRLPRDGLLRLMAISAEPLELKNLFKLSNEEALRIRSAVVAPRLSPTLRESECRVILYSIGAACWQDRVALDRVADVSKLGWTELKDFPHSWTIPKFPLTGQILLDHGFAAGPEIGSILTQVEDWWLASDFEPGQDELLARALNLKGKTMADLIVMKTTGKTAPEMERGAASPDVLISGKYTTKTWNHFTGEDDRLYCGIWECTPGKVNMSYDEWEFCHFIEGEAILTNDEGKSWRLKAGDGFIIPAGFSGTWETVKKVRKHYVILNPKAG